MSSLNVQLIGSIFELREKKILWDDLWQRSSIASPLAQAELIAQWVDQFAPKNRFHALVVESQGRFLAALPLVETRKSKIISTGMNPSNAWSMCGQLLVDSQEDAKSIVDTLISGFRKLPFSILWLDFIRFDAPEWLLFRESLENRNIPSQWLPRYPTAVLQMSGSFEDAISTWNKKKVHEIRRRFKKYYPPDKFQFIQLRSEADVASHLHTCFELEHKGWKGADGGSILNRKMDAFMTKQAITLSKNGELTLFVLMFENKIIAYKYCFFAKNTVFTQKSSYDPNFREFAPGQVIQLLVNEELCRNDHITKFDFVGELMPNQRVWNPTECMNGQVVLPLNKLPGRLFFFLYDMIMPKIRKFKKNAD